MRTKAVILCLLLASLAPSLYAQARGRGSIRGQVVAPGRPTSAAIEVVLERDPNRQVSRTTTDSFGQFEFHNLDAGRYEISVQLEGYKVARQAIDLERNPDAFVDPAVESDPGVPRAPMEPGILDQSQTIYIVLVSEGAAENSELARYPRRVIQEYEKAQDENRKGNGVAAIRRYEALLIQAPDFYEAHAELGVLYQKQNRFRDAERQFLRARELKPQIVGPLVSLGALYLAEADAALNSSPETVGAILDEALDILEEGIQVDPSAATAYYLLGTAYYKSVFLEEAEQNLLRAIELDSRIGPARLVLINVYLQQQHWQKALEHIDVYAAANPNASNRTELQEIRSKVLTNLAGAR